MPLRITSAPISGIKKRKSTASRPRASPFARHPRQKPNVRPSNPVKSDSACSSPCYSREPLSDVSLSHYISDTAPVEDVAQAIRYIERSMFEDLPTRAGMNSTRITQVLNLRRSLPPLASVAHVHTLFKEPTRVEKEIVDLINARRLRRLIVPGRGNDAAGLGDCLVLTEDWENLVRGSSGLEQSVKDRFLRVLDRMGNTLAIPAEVFSSQESMALIHAGFLVSSSSLAKGSLSITSLPLVPFISVTGSASQEGIGDGSQSHLRKTSFFLSLPNTGPYLRLLGAGRAHLLSLLNKSGSGEAPLCLLRDRWDGAVGSDRSYDAAKRVRGERAGILPGRTKKVERTIRDELPLGFGRGGRSRSG